MAREEAINKFRKKKARSAGAEPYILDEKKVERTFWLSRPDGCPGLINRKMKRIILLEFKRTSDASETYYSDVKKTADTSMATHSYSDGPQRPGERSRLGGGTRYFHWSQGRDRSRKRRG